MDLKDFYFQNVTETEYHYRFRKSIEDVNHVYDITGDEEVWGVSLYGHALSLQEEGWNMFAIKLP